LCADLLSGLRGASHPHLIRRYHWILKQGLAPDPEAIVHVGARLTSKAALQWIGGKRGIPIIHAHPYPERIDPFHAQTERWQTETLPFVEAVEASPDPSWLEEWRRLDALIERLLEEHPSGRFTESLALQILSQHAPTHAPFFLSASMPVREADLFLFQSRPFFSNRGLSGIDGSIATAAGIAAASAAPVFAFIGDLAALHDLNSLPLLKKHPFTLIISNNGGGGIFLHLPIAQQTPHLQELFVASHSWRFAQAAQMFDLPYAAASNEQELRAALASHVSVIELITDSAQNRAYHETLHHAVAAQKRRPLP
jgi:2-succinyl-5-enolpyruvyl-6-hydroxy-3-cyclohexene-1-carboxylate synthase